MDHTGQQVAELTGYIMPQLLDAMKGEPDVEVLVSMVESLAQISALVPPPVLTQETQVDICSVLSMMILDSEARNMERVQTAEQDDWDEQEQEDSDIQQVKEEELLSRIGDCVGALIKTHSSAGFVTVFTQPMANGGGADGESASTLQLFWLRLQKERPSNERQVALCVFDDVVLYGGPQGADMVPNLLAPMRAYCLDPDADVRQAAAFGVGVCAQVGGEGFLKGGGASAVQDLEKLVSYGNSRSQGNEIATDNAVSALMKILEFQPAALGEAGHRIGELIVNYLPAKDDETEALLMHAALIRAVQQNDARILGQNNSNLGRIIFVLTSILGTNLIEEASQRLACDLLKKMNGSIPPEVLQNATNNLSAEQKQRLQQAIAS